MKLSVIFTLVVVTPLICRADFSDNLRWAIDGSARLNSYSSPQRTSRIYALGLDSHKVFSNNQGDIGYVVAQLYFTKISNQVPTPFLFDGADDQQFVVRAAHLNYTATRDWLPNIRLGHFKLPFGLENSIDTNGRLLDYHHGANLGTKGDWGIGLNKVLSRIKYSVSYTMGGKDEPKTVDGSSLITGRISSLDHHDFIVGFSFYDGQLDNKDRRRYALDIQYYWLTWGLLAEVAFGDVRVGQAEAVDEQYYLIELDKLSPNEQWQFYSQYIYDKKDSFDAARQTALAGLSYQVDRHWQVSVEFKKQLNGVNGVNSGLFRAQVRCRY